MPTAAGGIDKPVGIERGPGNPGGNGLLTASVYADGLTTAVGIDATSSIHVARLAVGWQIYADGLAVGIERGPGYPGGNGLLTASVYADGLTAAVGIDLPPHGPAKIGRAHV